MTPNDAIKIAEIGSSHQDNGALGAAMAGMPDPAVLARLAGDFFREFAGGSIPQGTESVSPILGSQSIQQASETAHSITPQFSGADLQGLANSVQPQSFPAVSQFGLPAGVAIPEIPGANTYSFLQEVRSLFGQVPAVPVQAVPLPPTTKIPTETEVLPVASTFMGTAIPGIPEIPGQNALAPLVPGVPVPSSQISDHLHFGFLKDLQPLAAIDVVPRVAPLGSGLPNVGVTGISSAPFDVNAVRRDFPILRERVHGRPLIWLDNAATTQKPQVVIDRLKYFYEHENSNIHRAAHDLAARATDAYEAAREKTRRFLNASSVGEIIFVRGATEGINLVAQSWGKKNIQKDDEVVITWLEHHANIVPWQMLCSEKGARLKVAPVDNQGQIILEEYEKLLGPRTKLVSLTHVSNALGTVTPVREMVDIAHRRGAKVLVDGAQAVSHMRVDVQTIGCDFYVFSGHKVFAPTGIGVVFGRKEVLEDMPPWQGGGNMISDVTFEKTLYHGPPLRFEAGTGNIADAVGLGAAIDYLDRVGMENISRHEHELLAYGTEVLRSIPGLHLIGNAREKAGVLSFVLDGFRNEEIGEALNREGIAVRSGHHCAQPILRRFGLESTVRPSLALYNTCEDIDALASAIWNIKGGRGPGVL